MDSKQWYQSKTIWGIVFAALGTLLMKFGVDAPQLPANADYEQIALYVQQVKDAQGSLSAIAGIAFSAFGFILALIGRVKADTTIK